MINAFYCQIRVSSTMKINNKLIVMAAVIALNSATFADVTQVWRYTTVANIPNKSQTDLLSQIIQIKFPQNVQTIGESIEYLLRFSGYSLVSPNKMDDALKIISSKPLPLVDRELGPVTLRQGLITLTGT